MKNLERFNWRFDLALKNLDRSIEVQWDDAFLSWAVQDRLFQQLHTPLVRMVSERVDTVLAAAWIESRVSSAWACVSGGLDD